MKSTEELAREAGIGIFGSAVDCLIEELERFRDLIRNEVLEEAARVCGEIEEASWSLWKACADPHDQGRTHGAEQCSAAIRALKKDLQSGR